MKRFFTLLLLAVAFSVNSFAQGWPANYGGVMLQGFYWDSFNDSKWTNLESQAAEFGQYFDLVWIPQSGYCGGQSMGYDDQYWFTNYNSSFGTKAQLLSLINTFKANGIGTIGDIVINHRRSNSGWFGFPSETYNDVTYTMGPSDVCSDDDNGKAATEATRLGVTLGNPDTGEGWDGMRDLDHKSVNVQNTVKAYLKMLIDDFGYTGFRYDMVKGYSPEFTGIYNAYSQPQFSVGECWDKTSVIRRWIDGTKVEGIPTSAAFDFQFRYTVRNACNSSASDRWNKLNEKNDVSFPLVSKKYEAGKYSQYAVTFVENHDTEYRSSLSPQDPLKKDTLAANAWMLALPGTPCVFYKHWLDCKQEIKSMIFVRKLAGVTNTSDFNTEYAKGNGYLAAVSNGNNSDLLCVVGDKAYEYQPGEEWIEVLSGYHFRYFLKKQIDAVFINHESGVYEGTSLTVKAINLSPNPNAKLVYTLDGSEPTAVSQQVANNGYITINTGNTILKVGLLINGVVSAVQTRHYEITGYEPYDITVYVYAGEVGWNYVNFWSWGGNNSHGPKSGGWPGDKVSIPVEINGAQWFTHTYTIHSDADFVNLVFSTGTSGSPQTVDVNGVRETSYFYIANEKSGNKYLVNVVTGIKAIENDQLSIGNSVVYDLQGRRVASNVQLPKGIYIVNGKKVVIR